MWLPASPASRPARRRRRRPVADEQETKGSEMSAKARRLGRDADGGVDVETEPMRSAAARRIGTADA